jgi:copper resistance protein D
VDELLIPSRFVHLAALTFLFGGSLFRIFVQGAESPTRSPFAIDIFAAIAALLSWLGWFVAVAASMTGGWFDILHPDILSDLIFETRFGGLWICRLALLAAVFALTLAWRSQTWAQARSMLVLSGAAIATLAGTGHGSMGTGVAGLVHFAADIVHLLCAAAWLGGLACLGLAVRAARKDEIANGAIRTMLPRFTRLGYVAVAALLTTGCVNTMALVAQPEALIATDYGRILLVKLGLVLIMIAIALRNRLALSPRILGTRPTGDEGNDTVALYRSVLVEQVAGMLVLAAVAFLGTAHPSAHW